MNMGKIIVLFLSNASSPGYPGAVFAQVIHAINIRERLLSEIFVEHRLLLCDVSAPDVLYI